MTMAVIRVRKSIVPAVCAAFLLSGCGGGIFSGGSTPEPEEGTLASAEFTRASFSTTNLDGYVARALTDVTERRVRDSVGIGYAYKGGVDDNGDYNTIAALHNVDDLEPADFTGTATFTGSATAIYADVNRLLDEPVLEELSAPFSITANLTNGSFTGRTTRTTNSNLDLLITGQINEGVMSGNGVFENNDVEIDTDVRGMMSNDKAVAVFQGEGSSVSVAGGIYATR